MTNTPPVAIRRRVVTRLLVALGVFTLLAMLRMPVLLTGFGGALGVVLAPRVPGSGARRMTPLEWGLLGACLAFALVGAAIPTAGRVWLQHNGLGVVCMLIGAVFVGTAFLRAPMGEVALRGGPWQGASRRVLSGARAWIGAILVLAGLAGVVVTPSWLASTLVIVLVLVGAAGLALMRRRVRAGAPPGAA